MEMRTADERGGEGASDSRSSGGAASRSEGGALQEHLVDGLRRAMESSFEDDSGWAERCCRGICEEWADLGRSWKMDPSSRANWPIGVAVFMTT
jgi:hypothetical protein